MAAISGLIGQITYAAGYTTLADGWTMSIDSAQQDLTPLQPTANHQQLMTAGLLRGATGTYSAKLAVAADAVMTSDHYDPNPEEWTFENFCEAREITPLGADWRTYISGLKSTRISYITYLDDTEALPDGDDTGDAVLTASAGNFYTVPYVVESMDSGVNADDTERRLTVVANGDSAPTPTGTMPVAGTTGAATFLVNTGGPSYTCTILITGVRVRVNRRTSEGTMDFTFVANGAVTPVTP